MTQSCTPKFYCTETTNAICDENYTYKCEFFACQKDFPPYCQFDPNRSGACASFNAIRLSMTQLLKKEYGLGHTRWKKIEPIDYADEGGWNTKGR
jgi:hypothetical protein